MSDVQTSSEELIGEVTHYFPHVGAAVFRLETSLQIGETIHILGHTTDFVETVESMQIDHATVEMAGAGDDVAVLVSSKVREGDKVYRVE